MLLLKYLNSHRVSGCTAFPRFRHQTKFSELGDLLMEIRGAKKEGYLTGLSYLDTSRGIGPIADKLPYGFQETWVSSVSWYKEDNHGHFPPFDYFCDFVCDEAKRQNDLALFTKSGKAMRNFNNKAITVHKTVSTTNRDPNKNCPLHLKMHPRSGLGINSRGVLG